MSFVASGEHRGLPWCIFKHAEAQELQPGNFVASAYSQDWKVAL